jgi:hypothetical protein
MYTYVSFIKINVVALYEGILRCFIKYRNAILTFLTLLLNTFLKKKL